MDRPLILIPRGGRNPKEYSDTFFLALADEYKHMTQREIAEHHNVSTSTVTRWIRKGRDRGLISDERKPPR